MSFIVKTMGIMFKKNEDENWVTYVWKREGNMWFLLIMVWAQAKYIKGNGVSVKQVDWINSINWHVFSPRLHVNLVESRYKAPHWTLQKNINQGHILVLYSVSK
jgi:hypothetical protein